MSFAKKIRNYIADVRAITSGITVFWQNYMPERRKAVLIIFI